MKPFEPVGAWDKNYAGMTQPYCYGNKDSYRVAASLLDGLPVVEDWGCGCAFARQFFHQSKYVGVDGSKSQWCDVVDNLLTRDSQPDGILMRHVLEHNNEWKKLISNALANARQRLVIVFFLQWTDTTRWREDNQGIPIWQFSKEDMKKAVGKPLTYDFALGGDTVWVFNTG